MIIGPLPPPIGGATRLVESLATRLQQRSDLEVFVVDTSHKGRRIKPAMLAIRTLLTVALKGRDVDVITFHANQKGRKYLGPLVYLLAQVLHRPLIVRAFGGTFDNQFSRLNKTFQWCLQKTYLNADLCLLETHRLVEFFRPCARRVEWFSNYTRDVGLTEDTPIRPMCNKFVFISRVVRAKGIDTLVNALPLLDPEVSIDVFGPLGDDYTLAFFESLERNHQLTYRGVLGSPDDVARKLWEYDALVLPTCWEGEGYPAVILEAYAHGIPVITTRWESIPEIVDATNGLLVEPCDITGLAEAINRLHWDPSLYQLLQRGAREKSREFSESFWVEQFVRWCYEVAGRGSRAS